MQRDPLVGFHGVELSMLTIPSLTTAELTTAEPGRLGAEIGTDPTPETA